MDQALVSKTTYQQDVGKTAYPLINFMKIFIVSLHKKHANWDHKK